MSGVAAWVAVFYVFHSCFCVLRGTLALVFDYPSDVFLGGLRRRVSGFVGGLVKGKDVLVLFSHGHEDHYGRGVLEAVDGARSVRIVASEDVVESEGAFFEDAGLGVVVAEPRREFEVAGLGVKVFQSTDVGVAYLVDLGGVTLYHSGDLARWVWPSFPEEFRKYIDNAFRREVEEIARDRVDVALVVAEPELPGWGGVDYFAEKVSPAYLVPMHLRGRTHLTEKLKEELGRLYPHIHFVMYKDVGEEVLRLELGV